MREPTKKPFSNYHHSVKRGKRRSGFFKKIGASNCQVYVWAWIPVGVYDGASLVSIKPEDDAVGFFPSVAEQALRVSAAQFVNGREPDGEAENKQSKNLSPLRISPAH